MSSIIDRADAELLVKSDEKSDFRMVMGRCSTLRDFFDAHCEDKCEHLKCFIKYIHILSDREPDRLIEMLQYFHDRVGELDYKLYSTEKKFKNTSKTLDRLFENDDDPSNQAINLNDLLKDFDSGNQDNKSGESGEPPAFFKAIINMLARKAINDMPSAKDKTSIAVTPFAVHIKGDIQPNDRELDDLLRARVPDYKPGKLKIVRLDSDGNPYTGDTSVPVVVHKDELPDPQALKDAEAELLAMEEREANESINVSETVGSDWINSLKQ